MLLFWFEYHNLYRYREQNESLNLTNIHRREIEEIYKEGKIYFNKQCSYYMIIANITIIPINVCRFLKMTKIYYTK